MNEAHADYVYPILALGLRVKGRLARGEEVDLDLTQREFIRLLDRGPSGPERGDVAGDGQGWAGLRYALTCWLDEIFIEEDSRWSEEWRRRSLEFALYKSAVGGRQFPAQSELALRTRGGDVVEAFFLCWMLGFRGRLRDDLQELAQGHVEPARKAIGRALKASWEPPPKREPRSEVPPLVGRERFQKMVLIWVATAVPLTLATAAAAALWGR
jgi:type IV/VI secretion system ImpK/VasF family protein